MAALLDIDTMATDRSAGGFIVACAAGNPAALPTGENSIVRHRGVKAAGETNALVARCVL